MAAGDVRYTGSWRAAVERYKAEQAEQYRAGLAAPPDLRLDARVPPPGNARILFVTLVPWSQATTVSDHGVEFDEWFGHGSLSMPAHRRVPFVVGDHEASGGTRVGWVRDLIPLPHQLDAAVVVDDTDQGDTFLTFLEETAKDPEVSIAFSPANWVDYPPTLHAPRPQRQYTRAELVDVAVVPRGQYGDKARVWGRGDEQSLNAFLYASRYSK